jgi:hypothetical protein
MNFGSHHIERCFMVCVRTSEMLEWIEFAIKIGPWKGGNCSIPKMDQL